jgi:ATP synthase protein I
MGQDDRAPVLEELDKKIRRAKSVREKQEFQNKPGVGISYAFRLTTEMAAALVVGAGIGWLMDSWLGTGPWGMLVFLFVGFVAGILNAYRTARRIADFTWNEGER